MTRTVVVVALAVALCVVGAAPAAGHWQAPVKVHTIGARTGPGTAAGTFTARIGPIRDSGTYTETLTVVGDAITAIKFLKTRRGTVEMHMNAWIVPTPTTITFRDGQWEFRNGTGAYRQLKGGGRPAVASGGADVATGIVDVVHRGKARFGGHGHH